MPNQEPASAWIFGNSSVRVGTQRLFRPYLNFFVLPFLPTRLTAPVSPGWPIRQDSVENREKVYSKLFKLSLSLSFTHLIGSNCLYYLKGDLSPVMLKEIFHSSFESSEITRIFIENHASVNGWMDGKSCFLMQTPPTFGGRCNHYFWGIRRRILRLPNFNMLFQLVLTKFFRSELFSCLPKVDHVIKSCKEPKLSENFTLSSINPSSGSRSKDAPAIENVPICVWYHQCLYS